MASESGQKISLGKNYQKNKIISLESEQNVKHALQLANRTG